MPNRLPKAGKESPSDKAAHHIVEKGDKSVFAKKSRRILEGAGIGIHSVENGIGLSNHSGQHTAIYSQAVNERLKDLQRKTDIIDALRRIAEELRNYDDQGETVDDWA